MFENILFIDFSTSSTSICLYNIKEKTYNYSLVFNHYQLTKVESLNILEHKDLLPFKDVLKINVFRKKPMSRPKGNQHEFCRKNIKDSLHIKQVFFDSIELLTFGLDRSKIIVGWEDYPSSIKSNNQVELAETTMQCKSELFKYFDEKNCFFYQPQLIKSMSGNGNATKLFMLNHFLKTAPKNKVHDVIFTVYKKYLLSKDKVKKPIEDLVDSYFGIQLIRKDFNL